MGQQKRGSSRTTTVAATPEIGAIEQRLRKVMQAYAVSRERQVAPTRAGGIAGVGPRPSAQSVHRLKVTLRGSKPAIWRRLEVPSRITLAGLHQVLQIAMGWEDGHLHAFSHDRREFDSDSGFDERTTELWAVMATTRGKLRYTYDFGDDWIHEIAVERVDESKEAEVVPRCAAGSRAGPPEDCGGIWGLEDLLRYGREPDDMGEAYDPEKFSVEEVNARLTEVFGKKASKAKKVAGGAARGSP